MILRDEWDEAGEGPEHTVGGAGSECGLGPQRRCPRPSPFPPLLPSALRSSLGPRCADKVVKLKLVR